MFTALVNGVRVLWFATSTPNSGKRLLFTPERRCSRLEWVLIHLLKYKKAFFWGGGGGAIQLRDVVYTKTIIVFKSLFVSTYPKYLKELFTLRNSTYLLRGKNILTLPELRTTCYGLESIKYEAVKYWNSLSDSIRATTSLKDFKKAIKKHERLEF